MRALVLAALASLAPLSAQAACPYVAASGLRLEFPEPRVMLVKSTEWTMVCLSSLPLGPPSPDEWFIVTCFDQTEPDGEREFEVQMAPDAMSLTFLDVEWRQTCPVPA